MMAIVVLPQVPLVNPLLLNFAFWSHKGFFTHAALNIPFQPAAVAIRNNKQKLLENVSKFTTSDKASCFSSLP